MVERAAEAVVAVVVIQGVVAEAVTAAIAIKKI